MQPSVLLIILERKLEKILDCQILIDQFLIIPKKDRILGGYDTLGMLDYVASHHLLLLSHRSVGMDQDSECGDKYLHIFNSTGLPICSTESTTGQSSGFC